MHNGTVHLQPRGGLPVPPGDHRHPRAHQGGLRGGGKWPQGTRWDVPSPAFRGAQGGKTLVCQMFGNILRGPLIANWFDSPSFIFYFCIITSFEKCQMPF